MNTDIQDTKHKELTSECWVATCIEVGLLLNFGPKPEIKRKVFDNFRK